MDRFMSGLCVAMMIAVAVMAISPALSAQEPEDSSYRVALRTAPGISAVPDEAIYTLTLDRMVSMVAKANGSPTSWDANISSLPVPMTFDACERAAQNLVELLARRSNFVTFAYCTNMQSGEIESYARDLGTPDQ